MFAVDHVITSWCSLAEQYAARAPTHRASAIVNGAVTQLPCQGLGMDFYGIDVPAYGNCLYHAVWTSAKRVGVRAPFGVNSSCHVFQLRVDVARTAVNLFCDEKVE